MGVMRLLGELMVMVIVGSVLGMVVLFVYVVFRVVILVRVSVCVLMSRVV